MVLRAGTRSERLEEVADVLETLAAQLRAMMRDEGDGIEGDEEEGYAVGRRVRIVVRDKYYGRTAVLVSRRGNTYWNLVLDSRDGEVGRCLYKAERSLQLIET